MEIGMSPHQYFLAERERRLQLLLNAGIEEDRAYEVASAAAMDATEKKIVAVIRRTPSKAMQIAARNADNFETSPNVYGSEQ
jgi:hypothetical protein